MLSCATPIDRPLIPHSEGIRTGKPGAPRLAYSGYYTDGESWLSIDGQRDSASLVSLTGHRVPFRVHLHGPYVSGRTGESDFAALYDTSGVFYAELRWSDGEQEEYTTRTLDRKP